MVQVYCSLADYNCCCYYYCFAVYYSCCSVAENNYCFVAAADAVAAVSAQNAVQESCFPAPGIGSGSVY